MTAKRRSQIASRKRPQQARSNELVAAILQAAAEVLAKEGVARFTTARVADRAGVSVGSIYQYFPNKASILFRLQADEWSQNNRLLRDILEDSGVPYKARIRLLAHRFIESECAEAGIRGALNDAAPRYRDTDEARATRSKDIAMIDSFMLEVLPEAPLKVRNTASNLLLTTLTSAGHSFSRRANSALEIAEFSDAMADMLCAYIASLREEPAADALQPHA